MNPDPASLDRLHDIVAPPPVPWWPPAPGWSWVIAFLLVLVLVLALRAIIRWQHHRYRREALAELAQQEAALTVPRQRATALASLSALLKRTALSAWPRSEVAALNGPAWFSFLDRTGRTTRFSSDAGALLENAAYNPRQAQSLDEAKLRDLVSVARHWITHHKSEDRK